MDHQALIDQYVPLLRKHLIPISLAFLGLCFVVYGVIASLHAQSTTSDIVFESEKTASNSANAHTIFVDVAGAVVKPGVYAIPFDARMQDAITAAGGFSENANTSFVSKNINLAAKVTDGAKIYIPLEGEQELAVPLSQSKSTLGAVERININTASEALLDSLPGVGSVTSQKIIDGRPYSNISDLVTKKIITGKVFEKIKDNITL